MRVFKTKPIEWLEENAYRDIDGDWWENEKDEREWCENSHKNSLDIVMYLNWDWIINDILIIDYACTPEIEWGIEYEMTKENYPEYFL